MAAKKTAAKQAAPRKGVAKAAEPSALEETAVAVPAKTKRAPAKKAPRKTAKASDVSEGETLSVNAARFAFDMKAENIVVLDVSAVSSITDFFVVCNGSSLPHLKAIVREVRERMHEVHGLKPRWLDGQTESQWLVLDYGIMMVHAFHPEKRDLYALDDLWGDARKVNWQASA